MIDAPKPQATWYFDVVSPFAYLHWRKLKPLVETHAITPVPVLFGAVLDALGQRGPAEIPGKREFTYRHVVWQAARDGVPLRFPPAHPFNPLHALRLCIAAGNTAEAIDAVFDWIWAQGNAGDTPEALAPVMQQLGVDNAMLAEPRIKAILRENSERALAEELFGVPTLAIDGALFWGNDAHDFAMAVLRDPALLEMPEMRRVASLPVGARRPGSFS